MAPAAAERAEAVPDAEAGPTSADVGSDSVPGVAPADVDTAVFAPPPPDEHDLLVPSADGERPNGGRVPAGPGPALVELPTVPVAGPSAPLEGSDLPGAVVREAMAIDGALAVAVADSTTGSLLARTPDPDRLDLADAVRDYAAVVASMHETLARMGRTDHVEDVLVTYGGQYHVLRMLAADPTVFVLLVLDRRSATLALARMRLSRVERDLRR